MYYKHLVRKSVTSQGDSHALREGITKNNPTAITGMNMDSNPAYGTAATIKMDSNPAYGTAATIKMNTNPAYASST